MALRINIIWGIPGVYEPPVSLESMEVSMLEGMPRVPSRRPRIRGAMAGAAEEPTFCGISFRWIW